MCKLKGTYLCGEVFKDGGEVDGGSGTDTFGVFTGFEETSDTTNGELKAGFAAS